MPAIITHHLFGEDASRRLPNDLSFAEEDLVAFLLGNQGSDPFYFCLTATPTSARTCRTFARTSHRIHPLKAIFAVRDAMASLPDADKTIGRAFALGLLAHYLLDSEAHAFISTQQDAICNAGVGLEDARYQVHALLESELDTWMLWSTRKLTIAEVPAWSYLARTDRVSRVGGAIFSQVAWQAYEIALNPDLYETCLRNYELLYKVIDPLGNPRIHMVTQAEQLVLGHSHFGALAHSDSPTDNCPAANLACHPWCDPLNGTEQTTSFPDIFYNSLDAWPKLAEAFVEDDRTLLDELMVRGYDGGPRKD